MDNRDRAEEVATKLTKGILRLVAQECHDGRGHASSDKDIAFDIVTALRASAEEARREEFRRWLDTLCSGCNPNHVLDNGRVWGFCGTWKVIPSISEEDIAAAIRARGEGKG